MSHLACADEPDHPLNARQRAAFDQRRAALPSAPASLAASDGLMLGAPFHYDLVRPGYALYGGQAFQGGATPVNPVVTVAARILHDGGAANQTDHVMPGGYRAAASKTAPVSGTEGLAILERVRSLTTKQ